MATIGDETVRKKPGSDSPGHRRDYTEAIDA